MKNIDAYMTIAHLHNNPNKIVLRSGFLIYNVKCYTYSIDDSNDFIIFQEDIDIHKEQLRTLNLL